MNNISSNFLPTLKDAPRIVNDQQEGVACHE
jgi:hypothetical protein